MTNAEAPQAQAPQAPSPSRLKVSLLNFGYYHAFGFAIPYFTLYLSRILVLDSGRPANHLIGLILLLFNGSVLISTPIAGYVADRFRIGNAVLAGCAAGVAFGAALIALPGFLGTAPLEAALAVVVPGVIIAGLCLHPIVPLIDTQTLHYLHYTRGQASDYGRIRMLGSVGFTFSTLLVAIVLARTNQAAWTFALFAAGFLVLAAIAATGVQARPKPVGIPWRHLGTNTRFQRFLVFAFFASLGVNSGFLFTSYFLDEVGAGFVIMGFTFAVSVVPEIPIMFNAGALIRRIGGSKVILLGVGAQVAKLALFYSFAGSPATWVFAVVSILHGVGFGLLYTGCITFVDNLSHPSMRATYQNLFRLLWVTAVAAGGPISGAIIDAWDTTTLMGIYAVMLLAISLYFAMAVDNRRSEHVI